MAQPVFLQAWRNLRTLHAPAAFNAWLGKLTVNVWLQYVRTKRAASESIDDHSLDLQIERVATSVQLDPAAALDCLPTEVRLRIVLAYNEGMSHGEISEALDTPLFIHAELGSNI